MRFIPGVKNYDRRDIKKWIKGVQMRYIHNIVEHDQEKANEKLIDITQNEKLLFIMFAVKLIELIILIFISSYMFTCIWIIICEAMEDFVYDTQYVDTAAEYQGNFFPKYELEKMETKEIFLIVFYFSFTSLTTVGFGDYSPQHNVEQVFCAFMLLFGALIFSFIMGEYGALLDEYKTSNEEYEEGDKLKLFFGVMRKFNDNEEI